LNATLHPPYPACPAHPLKNMLLKTIKKSKYLLYLLTTKNPFPITIPHPKKGPVYTYYCFSLENIKHSQKTL
jgi:hypothetical protein